MDLLGHVDPHQLAQMVDTHRLRSTAPQQQYSTQSSVLNSPQPGRSAAGSHRPPHASALRQSTAALRAPHPAPGHAPPRADGPWARPDSPHQGCRQWRTQNDRPVPYATQHKILACHRLRKKDRAVVRFEVNEDKNKVYEARFPKNNQPRHKVIIQENLTNKRAKQVHQHVMKERYSFNSRANR